MTQESAARRMRVGRAGNQVVWGFKGCDETATDILKETLGEHIPIKEEPQEDDMRFFTTLESYFGFDVDEIREVTTAIGSLVASRADIRLFDNTIGEVKLWAATQLFDE